MKEKTGAYLVGEQGSVFGHYDDTRLRALVWYKRLWAKISKSYRRKHIDIIPFEINIDWSRVDFFKE